MSKNTVNRSLTRNRRREVVDKFEYADFCRRVLRAYSRRVAQGDVESLVHLVDLSNEVDAAIRAAVSGLRRFGYSWGEIAKRLGVSRQAAHQRWGGDDT
jgi:DNA-directed RNA polymerase specialized sigma24 family protein